MADVFTDVIGNTYTIVDRIPEGYRVWHIFNLGESFLPLCRKIWAHDGIEDRDNVDLKSLAAIPMEPDEVEAVMEASFYTDSLDTMRRFVRSHEGVPCDRNAIKKIEAYKKAIPVMERISSDSGMHKADSIS